MSVQFLSSLVLMPAMSYTQPSCLLLYWIIFSASKLEIVNTLNMNTLPDGYPAILSLLSGKKIVTVHVLVYIAETANIT